ncbi:MAG: restriction endonuclease subunit S, partial [Bacilli bacterium]|nr:restriction endonuclease subunit S [Bacilli bacterium]
DFEFPDENGNPYKSSGGIMVESELGLIPFGWKVEKLGKSSISNLVKSGIKEFIDKKIYLATADVTNTTITNHNTYINMGNKPSRANMQPKQNTVWFAKMKASRKLIRVSDESQSLIDNYIFSTGFAGIECTKSLNYVWSFVSSNEFDELKNSLATGTTQEAINNGVINNMNFLVPSKNILTKFENVVREFYNKKELNDRENLKLAEMRDLLLPKLMSGEIRLPIEE